LWVSPFHFGIKQGPIRPAPLKWVADWLILRFINFWIRYGFLSPVNRAAKHFGVPGYDSIFEFWRGDITLLAEPPEFSGATLPPDHYFIGPLVPQDEFPMPDELAAIPRSEPLIYFAMGSSGTPEIVGRIVESFEGKPYRVIAPVKFLLALVPGVRVPPNVIVTDWVPAVEVNRLADLAVIHGGIGTVMTAALAGKPVVGVGMQIEQVANLACLERLGFAIRVRKSKDPSRQIQTAIEKLLRDPRAKEMAAGFAKVIAHWDGPKLAADLLFQHFGVVKLLHRAELGDMLFQQALVLLLRFVNRVDIRRTLVEVDFVALAHPKVLRFDSHL
jgi:UDP:flavonoid glycosyltransferase YjiC (YdhE family)